MPDGVTLPRRTDVVFLKTGLSSASEDDEKEDKELSVIDDVMDPESNNQNAAEIPGMRLWTTTQSSYGVDCRSLRSNS